MYLLMSFFDIILLGRIVNRFLKDLYIIDDIILWCVMDFIWCLFEIIGMIVVISYVILLFLVMLFVVVIFYFYI